jgi:hypothetical protein
MVNKYPHFLAVLLIGLVIVASGCADTSAPADNIENEEEPNEDSSEINNNSAQSTGNFETYTGNFDNTNIRLIKFEETQKYNLSFEHKRNFSHKGLYKDREKKLNFSANIQCQTFQLIAYNTTLFQNDQNLLDKMRTLNNTNSDENQLSENFYKQNEASSVKGTFYNSDTSKKVATCSPTEDHLNIQILMK